MENTKHRNYLIVFSILFIAGLIAYLYSYFKPYNIDTSVSRPEATVTTTPNNTLDLGGYPDDWPEELIYPDEFTLIETSSGTLVDGADIGWGAVLEYTGSIEDAIDLMESHLTSHGWTIISRDEVDNNGILVVDDDNENGQSIVTFIADENGIIVIHPLIFPSSDGSS